MKTTKMFLLLVLCLLLTACGSQGEPAAASSEPEEPAAASSGLEFGLPQDLEHDELIAAHVAALNYYRDAGVPGTVLIETAPRAGEISFKVSSSAEGVITDLHIVVSLERQEGVWTVIREEEECWPEFMS